MPDTPAPIFCRNSHSSTTCGSLAAWRISVTPSARGGGKQRRLGAGHRRLVEVHRRGLESVGRLEHVVGPWPSARAHRAAARPGGCEIDRRAGKSPPGAARCALPVPRQQRPKQQDGPAQASDQRAVRRVRVDRAARTRRVVVPMPSTSAPRSTSRRAITSTSPMRGTFVRTHSSSVSRHAASSGSAAFLLPSTATRPSSLCRLR